MSALAERLRAIRSAPEGGRVCAFFDYDGTLIEGFSATAILRARLRSLEFTPGELLDGLMIALRGCSSEQDFAEVLEATRPAFAGKTYAELLAMGERLFKEDTASKLRPQMWQIIRAHRSKGHRIVIASSATRFQIEPIARQIDADDALATDVEVIDGIATGKILGRPLWGPGKAAAVRRLAAEHDLDLASSFAYSDGNEDVPYLEAVGHPAAVSPQRGLRAVAESRGWPILELRNPSHNRLGMLARTSAFYGSFLGGAAVGFARGVLSDDGTQVMQKAVSSGIDTGFALAGVRVDVLDGGGYLQSARPCVFVFNHQSKLDLPVMIHLIRGQATGVAKKEIRDLPLFGRILEVGGVAFIDRADAGRAIEQLEPVVRKVVDEGFSLVVAPEGTRSATPRIGEFKKGPFHIAMQAGVPVVPVVLRNAGELMWRGAQLIKPGTVEVRVLPPVDTSSWVPEKVGEYASQVRQQFLDALADWPVTAFDDGRMTRTMGVFEWQESEGDE
ncbi:MULTISPECIES: HAD-IB family hydrolase [Gordonia]|uniref:1-acyl-sn-glycerol-3-phosphate acyltransferase n=2 Tax=Gordonia TaxID=2053 RepID=L7LM82_9ACTN|nr:MULTISPECIES: HAD-IB family hydrolase [Gordonia]AUH69412.1 HAD-IB family hydrolase [Gordonia sp. YC-JH1]KJR06828.1 HAD family hydrolase [Gordonia sihwensis]MBY4571813.1 HAD family hydrolase [Gordonia sihwensis]WFN94262.1 HAD-IB family hydrolase [Gordonia sihwensis]GAC61148.1 1-acylglycerol-3-phosphate O-acyltransferase [Gordonia sihwensis NBRC 108236]